MALAVLGFQCTLAQMTGQSIQWFEIYSRMSINAIRNGMVFASR